MRIDAACEQRLEPRVDARPAKRLFHQRVETERGQMAFVKHDWVAQGDWPLVVGSPARGALAGDEIEKHPRAFAVAPIPGDYPFAIEHPYIVSDSKASCRLS